MEEQEELLEAEAAEETAEELPESGEEAVLRMREELEASRRELAESWEALRRERRLDAVGRELEHRGMAAGFAGYILGMSGKDEDWKEQVDRFEALFRESLSRAVTERMRGSAIPKEPEAAKGYRREELAALSRGEINDHWEEVMRSLGSTPQ